MFEAATTNLCASPEANQRKAWKATVVALCADELAALNIPPERVLPTKKKQPQLKGAESAQLLVFYQVSVVDDCTYVRWCKYARGVCRDLFNSTWSLSSILESVKNKVKWARKPVLNQWAAIVTGARSAGRDAGNGVQPETYETYTFIIDKFSAAEKERLMTICAAPVRDRY